VCFMPSKKNKGLRRSTGTTMPSSSPPQNNRRSVWKQWTDQQMEEVIDDVLNNCLKPTAAAVKHGISRSTLNNRLSGRVIHGTKPSPKPNPKPYLTIAEEKELAEQLIEAASFGYGKTRQEVMTIVERHIEQKEDVSFRADKVTQGWWEK